jgi:hypothetical protein
MWVPHEYIMNPRGSHLNILWVPHTSSYLCIPYIYPPEIPGCFRGRNKEIPQKLFSAQCYISCWRRYPLPSARQWAATHTAHRQLWLHSVTFEDASELYPKSHEPFEFVVNHKPFEKVAILWLLRYTFFFSNVNSTDRWHFPILAHTQLHLYLPVVWMFKLHLLPIETKSICRVTSVIQCVCYFGYE